MMYNHGSVCPVKLLHHNHRIFIEFHREREAELELWKDIPAESGERGTPERVPAPRPPGLAQAPGRTGGLNRSRKAAAQPGSEELSNGFPAPADCCGMPARAQT